MSLDALQPSIVSTPSGKNDESLYLRALPRTSKLNNLLLEAFKPDSADGLYKMTKMEKQRAYLAEYGVANSYVVREQDAILNIDQEFEDLYLEKDEDDDEDDEDGGKNGQNLRQIGVQNGIQIDYSVIGNKGHKKGKKNQNKSQNVKNFDDIIQNLSSPQPANTNSTSNTNSSTGFGIDNIFSKALTDDGLIADDFSTLAADLFAIDTSTTIDLFNQDTNQTGLGSSANKKNAELFGNGPVKRKAPSVLDTIDDIFDMDLQATIDMSDFDAGMFLSGATVYDDDDGAEKTREHNKERKKEQQMNAMYKSEGILTPQEELSRKRQRILEMGKK
jgi:hypothetical protein